MAFNHSAATTATPAELRDSTNAPTGRAPTHIDSVTQTSSSQPVEMSNLESKPQSSLAAPQSASTITSADNPSQPNESQKENVQGIPYTPIDVVQPTTTNPPKMPLDRQYSTAIGPSSDQPMPLLKDMETAGPTLMMTLLLTTGARHPFKVDSKYLNKRGIKLQGNDPFNMSVYDLKEMILREWREEWEAKPQHASAIRLISFGKLLDDKAPLKESKFNHDTPNVVHMTIKPQDAIDDEEAAKSKGINQQGTERSPGCRCVIL